jgi:hypothetical protein
MIGGRSIAPVRASVHWVLAAIVVWEVLEYLKDRGPQTLADRPVGLVTILLLTVAPGLIALGFVRLFLAVIQAGYGSLNAYTLTSSPPAWIFYAGLAIFLVGHGLHVGAHELNAAVPEAVRHGEFGTQAAFFDESLGHWISGLGLFAVNAVVLFIGQGSAPRVVGGEQALLVVGSLVTYGLSILYVGVQGHMLIPTLLGAAGLVAIGFRHLSTWEVNHDPVSLLIIPGTAAAGLVLAAWSLVVGGQPTWPL